MTASQTICLLSSAAALVLGAYVIRHRLRTSSNLWLAVFCVISSVTALLELALYGARTPEEVTAVWTAGGLLMFYIVSGLYLTVSLLAPRRLFRRAWFHGLVLIPPIFFSIAGLVIEPVTETPMHFTTGWVLSLTFTDGTLGKTASIWNDIIWVVTVSIPIYAMITARTSSEIRRSQLVTLAIALVFLYYATAKANPAFLSDRSLGLFSPVMIGALLLLTIACRRYETPTLTLAGAAEEIAKAMSDALFILDFDGRVVHGNRAALALMGGDRDRGGGRIFDWLASDNMVPQLLRSPGLGSAETSGYFECKWLNREKESIPVAIYSTLLEDGDGKPVGFLMIVRDITERERKESELFEHRSYLERTVESRTAELNSANESLHRSRLILRNLSERLFVAKEEESARIARELHDELGQILTGLKIDVTLLGRKVKKADQKVLVEDIIEFVDATIKRVQTLTKDLRPPMLEKLGLLATMEAMVSEFNRRQDITCTLYHDMDREQLPSAVMTNAYRIAQEALDNVVKHAKARNTEIQMVTNQTGLRITIRDDGVGMKEEALSAFESVGLLGMKERALSLGGRVEFGGAPGQGTTVSVFFPLNNG